MTGGMCATGGCGRPAYCRGWCRRCYARWHRRVYTPPDSPSCTVEGCRQRAKSRGLCNRHWLRAYHHGDPRWSPMVDAEPARGLLGWLRDEGAGDRWIGEQLGMRAGQVWAMRTGRRVRLRRETAERVRALAEQVGSGRLQIPGQAQAVARRRQRHARQAHREAQRQREQQEPDGERWSA